MASLESAKVVKTLPLCVQNAHLHKPLRLRNLKKDTHFGGISAVTNGMGQVHKPPALDLIICLCCYFGFQSDIIIKSARPPPGFYINLKAASWLTPLTIRCEFPIGLPSLVLTKSTKLQPRCNITLSTLCNLICHSVIA